MYIHRDWEYHAGDDLLSYIDKTENPVRDRTGRAQSSARTEAFLSKTENKQYVEHWVFSPKNADELSNENISIAVRNTMREHLKDGKRATYCYSVHDDVENTHAHIALTGKENDLMMDAETGSKMRQIGAEETREVERDRRYGRKIEEERRHARDSESERARETRAQNKHTGSSDAERETSR